MQKKGAIEFSMTTIIVVIIGVIILAIAIPWLTGTLRQAGGLTDAAFDSALKQLQADPTPSEPVVLSQDSFTLKRGEQAALVVRYLNQGASGKSLSFSGEAMNWFKHDNTQAKGQIYDWRVVVQAPNSLPDPNKNTYFARAEVGQDTIPIVINVE